MPEQQTKLAHLAQVAVCPLVRVGRLDLAKYGGDHEQPVWVGNHATEPINKHETFGGERANQIVEVFSLNNAGFFQTGNAVIAESKRSLFES